MQVSVEKVSSVECRLTIMVPAEQVKAEYTKQINQIAKNAELPGFRPGKAPISYIEQRFGGKAHTEALTEIMRTSLYEAIAKEKLIPVSQPRLEPKGISPDQPFEFIAFFEVMPEIGDVQFTMDNVNKLVVEIKPEDVERVINQLQKQYTKWIKVDRPAREKDRVVIDYYAVFDGKADLEHKVQNFPLELGSKTMLPGFEEGLIGAIAGEERTLHLTFPADFYNPEQAGKPIDFVIKVNEVYEAEMPTMDEGFVQKLGIKSGKEEDLRDQIKQSLDQERERLVKDNIKQQVFNRLLELNPLDVPKSVITREANQIHDEVYQHQAHDHHQHSEEEMNEFHEIAKKRVTVGLLIDKYAKQKNLKVDDERVSKRIEEIAAVYEQPQEVIAWLSSKERRPGVESQVMEDQVLDTLLDGIPVVEKVMSYAELKGIRI